MADIERLFVLDPGLAHQRGHHMHFAEGIARDAGARGIETHFFVARSAEIDDLAGRPFHKVFRHSFYNDLSPDPYDGALQDFHQGSNTYRDDLAVLLQFRPGAGDLIVQPTASFRTVGGFAKFRLASACTSPAAFLFHHMMPKGIGTAPGTLGGAIARMTGRMVTTLATRGRHRIGCTNAVLADKLAAAMDVEIPVLPLPHWYEPEDAVPEPVFRPAAPGVATVAFVGALRKEKGGSRMSEIVDATARARIGARLVVQSSDPDPALLPPMRALHEAGRIELVERELTDGEFARLVTDATLLLLPYDREPYAERISGLFCLAAACGTPCIVPDGTWMADRIGDGSAAGVAYGGERVEDIVAAMGRAVGDAARLHAEAASRADHWTSRESGSALLDALIEWAG
jgi:glycosyltransferase involved in cell wall biosynthesis